MTMMADRQAASFRSYKNFQDSHTPNQSKINKPTKPKVTSDMQRQNIDKYVP
jgi:hypothetical protein